jgi:hypothetical protein
LHHIKKWLAIWPMIFIFLVGCERPCRKNHIDSAFIGFSIADIDTIILRAYQPNGNFNRLVDTVFVHNLYATIYTTTNDTTIVYVNDSNLDNWVSSGFDWQIYIPAKNKAVSISNIETVQTEGGRYCLNPIASFVQDGLRIVPENVNTGRWQNSGYRAYIRN